MVTFIMIKNAEIKNFIIDFSFYDSENMISLNPPTSSSGQVYPHSNTLGWDEIKIII